MQSVFTVKLYNIYSCYFSHLYGTPIIPDGFRPFFSGRSARAGPIPGFAAFITFNWPEMVINYMLTQYLTCSDKPFLFQSKKTNSDHLKHVLNYLKHFLNNLKSSDLNSEHLKFVLNYLKDSLNNPNSSERCLQVNTIQFTNE